MTPPERLPVAVVGGGISGLVAAYELRARLGPDVEIALFEASPRIGGKLESADVAGVEVEQGADSFLVREPAPLELCRSLGLTALEAPAVFGATVWLRGRVRELPRHTIAGVPCSPWTAARGGFVSPAGAARMVADLVLPQRIPPHDISIASLVRGRLGREAMANVTDALLAGSRAGSPEQLSLAAAARELDAVARRSRSLMWGLRAAARRGAVSSGTPPFRSPVGGMGALVDALREALPGVTFHTSSRVTRLDPTGDAIAVDSGGAGAVAARGVILAVPAWEAADLLPATLTGARRALATIGYASLAVVTLIYDSAPPGAGAGSGMLVPSEEGRLLSACTWYSRKWPSRTSESPGFIVRAVVGRAGRHPALDWDDDDLTEALARELREAVGLAERPETAHVHRWERALPEYRVGHLDLVRTVREAMEREPRIELAGAALDGSGIPDCIRSAKDAAARLAVTLSAEPKRGATGDNRGDPFH